MNTPAPTRNNTNIIVRHLGLRDYEPVWHKMQQFTKQRSAETTDEIWLVEHSPVFTLGLNGKQEHVLNAGNIPLIQCDRGGQVTYHGPGQIIVYLLLDLQRRELGVKTLVTKLEMAVIELLSHYGINAEQRKGAPGVYIDNAKIAALGLRVKRGCCYHGLSFNYEMDLKPFSRINPCGYKGLLATQFRSHNSTIMRNIIEAELIQTIEKQLEA